MKNVPEKIYLNIGAKGMADDFKKLCEVTWCKDKIHEDDIEYTLTPIDSKEGAEVVDHYFEITLWGIITNISNGYTDRATAKTDLLKLFKQCATPKQ